jgi:hypothetical protein
LFVESLKLSSEYGNKIWMMDCLAGSAAVLGMIGKPEQAARLGGAAKSLLETTERRGLLEPDDQKDYDHYIAIVRGQLNEDAFAKAWEEGRAMTLEQAIEFALKETEP